MTPTEADGGSLPTDADLRRFTDDQRRADAAATRRREHWLRQQAGEEGSFVGVLVDLGERQAMVAVHTRAGRTLRGSIRTIGADFCALLAPGGESVLVPLDAVTALRAEPTTATTVGDRVVTVDATLVDALAGLLADRPRLTARTSAGDQVAGALVGVGHDLVVLRGDGGGRAYLRLPGLNDVTLP